MQKDTSFGKPESVCSSQDCTGLMPAAVPGEEQQRLDDLEGIHAPAPKKKPLLQAHTAREDRSIITPKAPGRS